MKSSSFDVVLTSVDGYTDSFSVAKALGPNTFIAYLMNGVTLPQDGYDLLRQFDAVFIGIHGTPGEDGKLQGYFDLHNLPYTSCDAAASAITFNKRYTVAVAAFAGINTSKSLHLFSDARLSAGEIAAQLKFPVFVKPNNGLNCQTLTTFSTATF